MQAARSGVRLRAVIGEADRATRSSVFCAIFQAAHAAGLAGATVIRGPLGFGRSHRVNSDFVVEAPGNLPIVVEIIDTEDRIQAFLPELNQLIGSGLVTMEEVRMFRCGRRTLDARASAERGP
jgi:uncharacterized protein